MRGFRIGSVFGIEIRIDYSWFVIFVLILWTLTRNVFPSAHPDQPAGTYILMGTAGTLLFFASLLAHELSHSLVARSRGIPVHSITLFIFGGVARTTAEFETPGDEFAIAAAGPLSSLLIAGMFWLISWGGMALDLSVAVTGVASYLALINFVLVVFNLFPGFPLDGGRLFRAAVWKQTGDVRRATRIATNGGKVFGYLLMVLGFLNMFSGNVIGGAWLVFIGWFIRMAAESSYVQHVLHRSLQGVRARDVMTADPQTIASSATLQQFLQEYVLEGRHHSYPVTANGHAKGLITLDRARQVPRDEWTQRSVRDAMIELTPDLAVAPDASMADTMHKLNASPVGRILVTDGSQLLGIISQGDVARWLHRERVREEIAARE